MKGFTCLWKGISSQLIVNSITIGVETAVTELNTKFYKKDHYSKWKEFAGQVALKVFTTAVTMPFYSAQLVESIQVFIPTVFLGFDLMSLNISYKYSISYLDLVYNKNYIVIIKGIEFSKPGYNVTIAKRPSLARVSF